MLLPVDYLLPLIDRERLFDAGLSHQCQKCPQSGVLAVWCKDLSLVRVLPSKKACCHKLCPVPLNVARNIPFDHEQPLKRNWLDVSWLLLTVMSCA